MTTFYSWEKLSQWNLHRTGNEISIPAIHSIVFHIGQVNQPNLGTLDTEFLIFGLQGSGGNLYGMIDSNLSWWDCSHYKREYFTSIHTLHRHDLIPWPSYQGCSHGCLNAVLQESHGRTFNFFSPVDSFSPLCLTKLF